MNNQCSRLDVENFFSRCCFVELYTAMYRNLRWYMCLTLPYVNVLERHVPWYTDYTHCTYIIYFGLRLKCLIQPLVYFWEWIALHLLINLHYGTGFSSQNTCRPIPHFHCYLEPMKKYFNFLIFLKICSLTSCFELSIPFCNTVI